MRLGVATGRDLAQACRDYFSPRVNLCLWLLCEIAIAACDLAEVLGSAIALQLLFGIPLIWGVCITVLDIIALLLLQHKGFRYTEALVIMLVATVGICFTAEMIFSRPDFGGILLGYVPKIEIVQVKTFRRNVSTRVAIFLLMLIKHRRYHSTFLTMIIVIFFTLTHKTEL